MVGSKNWAGLCFLSGHVVHRWTHNCCQDVYTTSNQSASAVTYIWQAPSSNPRRVFSLTKYFSLWYEVIQHCEAPAFIFLCYTLKSDTTILKNRNTSYNCQAVNEIKHESYTNTRFMQCIYRRKTVLYKVVQIWPGLICT